MRNLLVAAAVLLLVSLTACSREETEAPPEATATPEASQAPAPPPEPDRYPQQTSQGEEGARRFVQAFMRARLRGNEPRARAFLSGDTLAQYNTQANGITLMGAAGSELTDWEFGTVEAADANSFEVNVRVTQDAPSGGSTTFEETLFVGPGADFQGKDRPWIIRGVERAALEPNQ